MKKSRYTEEQIAFALKQTETGTPVAEVIHRTGEQGWSAGPAAPCVGRDL
jgi:hypothetical protein